MTSKLVQDRNRATEALLAAIDTYGPSIDEALDKLSKKKPSAPPRVGPMLSALGELTRQRMESLAAADAALADELADDVPVREERDEVASRLRAELVEIRETIAGAAGPAATQALGFRGDTPMDATAIVTLARKLARSGATKISGRRSGVSVDLAKLVSGLGTLADTLEAATRTLAREERERQLAVEARDAALALWNDSYQGLASTLEGLLRSVGEGALAEKIRPVLYARGASEADAPADPPVT